MNSIFEGEHTAEYFAAQLATAYQVCLEDGLKEVISFFEKDLTLTKEIFELLYSMKAHTPHRFYLRAILKNKELKDSPLSNTLKLVAERHGHYDLSLFDVPNWYTGLDIEHHGLVKLGGKFLTEWDGVSTEFTCDYEDDDLSSLGYCDVDSIYEFREDRLHHSNYSMEVLLTRYFLVFDRIENTLNVDSVSPLFFETFLRLWEEDSFKMRKDEIKSVLDTFEPCDTIKAIKLLMENHP